MTKRRRKRMSKKRNSLRLKRKILLLRVILYLYN